MALQARYIVYVFDESHDKEIQAEFLTRAEAEKYAARNADEGYLDQYVASLKILSRHTKRK